MSKVHHNAGKVWGRPYIAATQTVDGVDGVNPGQWVLGKNGQMSRLAHDGYLVPRTGGRSKKTKTASMVGFRLACKKPFHVVMSKAKRRTTVDQILDLLP